MAIARFLYGGSHGLSVVCDRFAVDPDSDHLFLLSCAGPKSAIQKAKDRLQNPANVRVELDDGAGHRKTACPVSHGYSVYTCELEYRTVHALFVAKTPGFMPTLSAEALWRHLSGPRYTTPMVREWVPAITVDLLDTGLLRRSLCLGCNSAWLVADSSELDRIVEIAVQAGEISIPQREAACA
jgi:hypothetical protein